MTRCPQPGQALRGSGWGVVTFLCKRVRASDAYSGRGASPRVAPHTFVYIISAPNINTGLAVRGTRAAGGFAYVGGMVSGGAEWRGGLLLWVAADPQNGFHDFAKPKVSVLWRELCTPETVTLRNLRHRFP